MAIYPKPASENLTIEFMNPKIQNVTIKLINTLGQKIKTLFTGSMQSGVIRKSYTVSDLSNGILYLSVEIDGKIITIKIVINK